MGNQGTATLNFGAFTADSSPNGYRNTDTTVVVTGQTGILTSSLVEAWVAVPQSPTADHSIDEHLIETFQLRAGNIIAGTGFTIYAECIVGGTYGAFTINWVWN